ncbi:MAG: DNA repair protein RadA, partial [Streptosporangiaceae bacterium]
MGKSAAAAALYQCSECGWQTTKWVGRCGECQQWGSVAESKIPARDRVLDQARGRAARKGRMGPPTTTAVPIAEVDATVARALPTGLGELDRVLGGGLVPGAVVLLAGEPGVGKSTLLLEA